MGNGDGDFLAPDVNILEEHLFNRFVSEKLIFLPAESLNYFADVSFLILGENRNRLSNLNFIGLDFSGELQRNVENLFVLRAWVHNFDLL